jgi:hypothetical protein
VKLVEIPVKFVVNDGFTQHVMNIQERKIKMSNYDSHAWNEFRAAGWAK